MYCDTPDYNEKLYSPADLKRIVNRVAKNLLKLKKKLKFDAVAFSGSSGAAIAYPVSVITGLHLVHVRKRENTHGNKVEGGTVKKYVILDDFICSGDTVRRIYKAIKALANENDETVECVGIVLHDDRSRGPYSIGQVEVKVYNV